MARPTHLAQLIVFRASEFGLMIENGTKRRRVIGFLQTEHYLADLLHSRPTIRSNGKMKYGRLPTIRTFISSSTHFSKPLVPLETNYLLCPPTSSSLSSALQHYINSDHPSHGQKIHSRILKTGFKPNTNISIKLLILHIKSSCLGRARQVFDEMPQPTLSAYNYMISGYIKSGQVLESLNLVRRLSFSDEKPDGFTFSMILKAATCGSVLEVEARFGKQVHAQVVKSDVEADDVLYTGLVDLYVKSGRVEYARRVFDLMLEKNVVCSTSMISGYMNQGCVADAEDIFNRTVEKDVVVYNAMIEGYSKSQETAKAAIEVYISMLRLYFRPTISTFASIIGACSVLSAFEIGEQVQAQLMKTQHFTDIKIGSSLIDMYAKCGRVEEARRVFDRMPQKNVFSWTSMIDGYGKNGHPEEALALFIKMQRGKRTEPNYVTFLGALSACGHAGLVAKGREIFNSMERDYSMKPKMEHYACMVDLLGRAGSLNLAWEFVMAMPEKPNSDVWAALLSACRLHGDVEMANVAAHEIFKLCKNSRPGAYVALSNTLAAAGKWDRVSEVRDLMKVKGISKDTGFSWVGTESGLEGFHVGQKMCE
ncbi:Pentatricopeptide repeat-containing protein [Actinidia chinensis var. chinensis]|uniref:Pentatricopeptide repeat-containing protein n=1 Tax=Actinidia chinensis var. chinensis TaxID=1590841 RepID=A0A2R6PE35_ACTCC|nr:Pentatricopeptide repeat-containing protein [Actinidia chinensis var. chinensis]